MFHGKSVTITEVQPVVETEIITADVSVVDVNVIIRSEVIEE
jgi:hypothetical protein